MVLAPKKAPVKYAKPAKTVLISVNPRLIKSAKPAKSASNKFPQYQPFYKSLQVRHLANNKIYFTEYRKNCLYFEKNRV